MLTLSRLQPHQIVHYDSRPHRVVRVNDCRAALLPVSKVKAATPVESKPGKPGPDFSGEIIGISPNSELPIIGRWDPLTATAHYFAPAAGPSAGATPVPLPITFLPDPEQVVPICTTTTNKLPIIHHIQTELF